uniref:Tenascin-X n=1 Tax=Globodera pallida TaxID=36090 RepID=A0A183C9Z0_GLOPA
MKVLNVNKECSCGWGRCHENVGIIAAGCCKEGFSWTCCEHAKQAQDECNKLCDCGWDECHPAIGLKPKATDCCAQGCKKKAAECKECDWGDSHPSIGFASDGCCSVGHQFKCCATAPEVLTPCEKLATKCSKQGSNWGECFPRDGYNGDACCDKGNAWKCGSDMTIDELIVKDPAYAKMVNCYLAGHPDMQSLKKCMPDESECKLYPCPVAYDDIERCEALAKCKPNVNNDQRDECNEPLPPIENAIEA